MDAVFDPVCVGVGVDVRDWLFTSTATSNRMTPARCHRGARAPRPRVGGGGGRGKGWNVGGGREQSQAKPTRVETSRGWSASKHEAPEAKQAHSTCPFVRNGCRCGVYVHCS